MRTPLGTFWQHRIAAYTLLACIFLLTSPSGKAFDLKGPTDMLQVPYYEDDAAPWAEEQPTLPPAPQTANLRPVFVSATATLEVFVDPDSLSIGNQDGVLRYTLVQRSSGGVRNISYEGMRCSPRETRRYAGWSDTAAAWQVSTSANWRPIAFNTYNPVHAALARYYFCPEGDSSPRSLAEIRQRLSQPPASLDQRSP